MNNGEPIMAPLNWREKLLLAIIAMSVVGTVGSLIDGIITFISWGFK